MLTEEEARDALQEACAGAFASAIEGPLYEALDCAVAHASESEFARVLQAMLAKRNAVAHLLSMTAEENPFPAIEARLRRLFNLAANDTRETLGARAALLDVSALRETIAVLSGGTKNDVDGAARSTPCFERRPVRRPSRR